MINEDLFSRTFTQALLLKMNKQTTNIERISRKFVDFAYALQIRMRAHIEAMSYIHCVFAKSSFQFMKMKIIPIDFLTKNFRLTKQGSEIQT